MACKNWHIGNCYLIISPLDLRRGVFPKLAVLASFGQDMGPSDLMHSPSRASLGHLSRHLPVQGGISWLPFLNLWLGGKKAKLSASLKHDRPWA